MTKEIQYPSTEQVSRLYERIIGTTGGEHGFLSKSNLDYLLDAVKDIGERQSRKQAIIKKAAFLLYDVIVTHPFLNGNKRIAYELLRLFLAANGYKISPGAKEGYQFLLGVASGEISESEVENWVARHLTEKAEG